MKNLTMTTRPAFQTVVALTCAAAVCALMAASRAQPAPGGVDLSFDPGSGIDGPVHAMVVQPDGKILVGGYFTTVRGLVRSSLARLLPDGSGDATFTSFAPGPVYSLALQADGKILVGHYSGINRLHADGTEDTSFADTVGADWEQEPSVRIIIPQPDGRVLIDGMFSTVDGVQRSGPTRLNADGSLDRSFVVAPAHLRGLQPDGRVLVWDQNASRLARLNADGSPDPTFKIDPALVDPTDGFGPPNVVFPQADGKMFTFAVLAAESKAQVYRLNPDGSLDPGFRSRLLPEDQFQGIQHLAAQRDGKVLISGPFDRIEGRKRERMARLNADGSLDVDFEVGAGRLTAPQMLVQPDGKVLIGYDDVYADLTRLQPGGSPDPGFNPGAEITDGVNDIAPQSDGKTIIAGLFRNVGGQRRPGLARLAPDGSLDPTFDPAISFVATASYVSSVTLQPRGKIAALGAFEGPGVVPWGGSYAFTKLNADGSVDTGFKLKLDPLLPTAPCPAGYWSCDRGVGIQIIKPQPDGTFILAGNSVITASRDETIDYFTTPFLVRIDADGNVDSGFTMDQRISDASPYHVVAQPGRGLLMTGRFTVDGVAREVIRLRPDGSLDPGFTADFEWLNINHHALAVQANGQFLIGGRFRLPPDQKILTLARFHADGTRDSTFKPSPEPDYSVVQLAVQPDGKVLVAGGWTTISPLFRSSVARLHADGRLDSGFQMPKFIGHVRAMALQPDSQVLLGGDFRHVDGEARPRVARLVGDSPMPPLDVTMEPGSAVLSWPSAATNVRLEEYTGLGHPSRWTTVPQAPQFIGARAHVTMPASAPQQFFRLSSP